MFPTVEVRWFFKGEPPPAWVDWFYRQEQAPYVEPGRVDFYLRLVNDDSLGIKLREGRIEVKQRYRQYGPHRFASNVAGEVEHWRKWSFPLAGVGEIFKRIAAPESGWLAVQKKRQQQKYQLVEEQVMALPPESVVEQGCDLELAQVKARQQQWWSVGVEAHGNEATLRQQLMRVTQHLFTPTAPLALTIEDSYSYPQWLRLLLGQD